MSRPARLAVFAALFVLAVVALELPDATLSPPTRPPDTTAAPKPTATPPSLTAAEVNRQDRVSATHRRRETRAFDARPLLAVLPLELAGVRIEIAGLAADQHTTILTIGAGPRGRRYALALYRRALAAYGDPGTAYAIRWAP